MTTLELLKCLSFFFFHQEKYFKGKKLITSPNSLYKLWCFSSYSKKKKNASVGLSLIGELPGFLNLS